jgi:hypothetical protein
MACTAQLHLSQFLLNFLIQHIQTVDLATNFKSYDIKNWKEDKIFEKQLSILSSEM